MCISSLLLHSYSTLPTVWSVQGSERNLVKAEVLRSSVLRQLIRNHNDQVLVDAGVKSSEQSKLHGAVGHHVKYRRSVYVCRGYSHDHPWYTWQLTSVLLFIIIIIIVISSFIRLSWINEWMNERTNERTNEYDLSDAVAVALYRN